MAGEFPDKKIFQHLYCWAGFTVNWLTFRFCFESVHLNTSTLLSDPFPAKDSDSMELVLKQAEALSIAWTS